MTDEIKAVLALAYNTPADSDDFVALLHLIDNGNRGPHDVPHTAENPHNRHRNEARDHRFIRDS